MRNTSLLTLIALFLTVLQSNVQHVDINEHKVYNLNYKWELPFTAGMFVANFYGFYLMGEKPMLSLNQVNALNQSDVWSFDRNVFSQSFSPPSGIYDISDIGLWTSYVDPVQLFIDSDIRDNWLDFTLLCFETQAINLNIYL